MKTLIVEDDFTSRFILQKMLSPFGETHVAVNGLEAVNAFNVAHDDRETYDLICLDIMMPEMDGLEVLKKIRQKETEAGQPPGQGVKIVMTTALNDRENVIGAFHDQADGYLVKPISKDKLIELINNFGLNE